MIDDHLLRSGIDEKMLADFRAVTDSTAQAGESKFLPRPLQRLAEFLENNLSHELRLCLFSHTKIVKVGQFGQDSFHEIQATDGSLWWASLLKLREAQ